MFGGGRKNAAPNKLTEPDQPRPIHRGNRNWFHLDREELIDRGDGSKEEERFHSSGVIFQEWSSSNYHPGNQGAISLPTLSFPGPDDEQAYQESQDVYKLATRVSNWNREIAGTAVLW